MPESYKVKKSQSILKEELTREFLSGKVHNVNLIDVDFSVNSVSLSKDLKTARCYISSYNQKISTSMIVNYLNKSVKSIRYAVSSRVNFKYAPKLLFYEQQAYDPEIEVNEILTKLKN